LKEILLHRKKSRADEFWALQDINLRCHGRTGRQEIRKEWFWKKYYSCKLLPKLSSPTTGEARVNGRVWPTELGGADSIASYTAKCVFFNARRLLGLDYEGNQIV